MNFFDKTVGYFLLFLNFPYYKFFFIGIIVFSSISLGNLMPVNYSVKLCTYVTIYLYFDVNSEVSKKEVIAFYR